MTFDPTKPYRTKSETEKFMEWYWKEREKGLVDIRFFVAAASGTTCEDVFREVNEAIAAPIVKDYEHHTIWPR